MAVTGTPVFDAIAITTLEADLLNKNLKARAAFVDTRRGATHGWTEGNGTVWSEETKAALIALVTSMERDLAKLHLGLDPETPAAEGRASPPTGLVEHLSDDDARSV